MHNASLRLACLQKVTFLITYLPCQSTSQRSAKLRLPLQASLKSALHGWLRMYICMQLGGSGVFVLTCTAYDREDYSLFYFATPTRGGGVGTVLHAYTLIKRESRITFIPDLKERNDEFVEVLRGGRRRKGKDIEHQPLP